MRVKRLLPSVERFSVGVAALVRPDIGSLRLEQRSRKPTEVVTRAEPIWPWLGPAAGRAARRPRGGGGGTGRPPPGGPALGKGPPVGAPGHGPRGRGSCRGVGNPL